MMVPTTTAVACETPKTRGSVRSEDSASVALAPLNCVSGKVRVLLRAESGFPQAYKAQTLSIQLTVSLLVDPAASSALPNQQVNDIP
jgi:hypothetical protein